MNELLTDLWFYPDALFADFLAYWDSLGYITDLLEIISWVFVVVAVSEMVFSFRTGRRDNLWEPLGNFACHAMSKLAETTFYGMIVIGIFLIVEELAIQHLEVNAVTWILCMLLTDFFYYWMHRVEHRVRILWTMHSIHHSSEEFDLTTGQRLFFFGDIQLWAYFIPVIFIGFDSAQVLTCMIIIFVYNAWLHTEYVPKLGILEYVFATPSIHRVHHGKNAQYIDKNFAGLFVIWDRLFGTYEEEQEAVRYGISTPVGSSNPIKITLHEFVLLAKDLSCAKSFSEKCGFLFRPPGWKPEQRECVSSRELAHSGQIGQPEEAPQRPISEPKSMG